MSEKAAEGAVDPIDKTSSEMALFRPTTQSIALVLFDYHLVKIIQLRPGRIWAALRDLIRTFLLPPAKHLPIRRRYRLFSVIQMRPLGKPTHDRYCARTIKYLCVFILVFVVENAN